MKKITLTAVFLCFCAVSAFADVPVAVDALPQPVVKTLQNYFPGSTILYADRDRDDGLIEYEVKIQYKDIVLEVELSQGGKILDVDMER